MSITISIGLTVSDDSSATETTVLDLARTFLSDLPSDVVVTSAAFTGDSLGTVDFTPTAPSQLDDAVTELDAATDAITSIAPNADGTYTVTADQVSALTKATNDVAAAANTIDNPPPPTTAAAPVPAAAAAGNAVPIVPAVEVSEAEAAKAVGADGTAVAL